MSLRGRKKKDMTFGETENLQMDDQDTTLTEEVDRTEATTDNTSNQDTTEQTTDTTSDEELDKTETTTDTTSNSNQDKTEQTTDTTSNQNRTEQTTDNTSDEELDKTETTTGTTSTQEERDVERKPPQKKQKTRIHLVDGEKGGVGKSLVARTMIQYCLDSSLPIIAVEADRSNPDVAAIYSGCAETGFSENERKADEADKIFELALSKSVIVNLPAQVYQPVSDWINKNGLIELGKQHSVSFCKWFVCTGGHDSIQLFLKSAKELGDKMPHVLVRNLGLCDDWSHVDTMEEVKNTINKYSVQVIDFPKFSYRERNMVDEKRISFAQARDSSEFGIVSRQRIHNFLKSAYAEFKNTGLLP